MILGAILILIILVFFTFVEKKLKRIEEKNEIIIKLLEELNNKNK